MRLAGVDSSGGQPSFNCLQHEERLATIPALEAQLERVCTEHLAEVDLLHAELSRHTGHIGHASEELRMALEVAYLAHLGQRRRSGENFITHPVHVAVILAEAQFDAESVIAGLLHDTVEVRRGMGWGAHAPSSPRPTPPPACRLAPSPPSRACRLLLGTGTGTGVGRGAHVHECRRR